MLLYHNPLLPILAVRGRLLSWSEKLSAKQERVDHSEEFREAAEDVAKVAQKLYDLSSSEPTIEAELVEKVANKLMFLAIYLLDETWHPLNRDIDLLISWVTVLGHSPSKLRQRFYRLQQRQYEREEEIRLEPYEVRWAEMEQKFQQCFPDSSIWGDCLTKERYIRCVTPGQTDITLSHSHILWIIEQMIRSKSVQTLSHARNYINDVMSKDAGLPKD